MENIHILKIENFHMKGQDQHCITERERVATDSCPNKPGTEIVYMYNIHIIRCFGQ